MNEAKPAKAVVKTAKAKTTEPEIALTAAKVKRLKISNFRCIGSAPVCIDLDDIVVLVGPNNAGKSTILRAYEVIMNHSSLTLEDFPAETVDLERLPQIELETYIWDDFPAQQWLHTETNSGYRYIRERWTWSAPAVPPVRQGQLPGADVWEDTVPWGAPNVAKSRRPIPHRVEAFARPEEQAESIATILQEILLERAQKSSEDTGSAIQKLTAQIRDLQKEIVDASKDDISGMEDSLSEYVKEIFVGFRVSVDAKTDHVGEKSLMFANKPVIRMGPENGHMAPLDKQGSGARRTLLWSALKIASERKVETAKKGKKAAAPEEGGDVEIKRPHVLLLDEPEICLHPSAIRDACRVLYDLAAAGSGWQVIVTTHAPSFIDVSRDNTTIVRVERMDDGEIKGTTVFRPVAAALTPEDKAFLKLLNQWDANVAEFFFNERVIVVEGDTEYSVFREIMNSDPKRYQGVHILRARGKYMIPALVKILNQFGGRYTVIHDTDTQFTDKLKKNGAPKANAAWEANQQIRDAVSAAPIPGAARCVASVFDFEQAMFGEAEPSDKPYNAVMKIRGDNDIRAKTASLLDYLAFMEGALPPTILAWNDIQELVDATGGA